MFAYMRHSKHMKRPNMPKNLLEPPGSKLAIAEARKSNLSSLAVPHAANRLMPAWIPLTSYHPWLHFSSSPLHFLFSFLSLILCLSLSLTSHINNNKTQVANAITPWRWNDWDNDSRADNNMSRAQYSRRKRYSQIESFCWYKICMPSLLKLRNATMNGCIKYH